jgi:hypothetical protein
LVFLNVSLVNNPENVDALESKGAYLLRLRTNRNREAMKCFEEALKMAERNVCSLFNKGYDFEKAK